MIRFLDFFLSFIGLVILFPIFILVFVVSYFFTVSPIFLQTRVGKNQKAFTLIKFRTMPVETQSIATHFVDLNSVTKLGIFLRKTKLDELPQLINVLRGEMSLVGPRPCLLSQIELIKERELRGVFSVSPGITGLAQIKNVNMSTPKKLAKIDQRMIQTMSLKLYLYYILLTVFSKEDF
ncbi:UDP-N-acetylgalactosaminyltransferase [Candidatus Photodesmus blepharus]|uniref:UDP-N-acetylgalactosaminyltransferase n=1 Tax=Candidatus Photodesmus blepharonis TaxID=1179155 RepID=A0A084CNT7_9GAMM|nr:sugar transferase [Candidatus Photodesmus blepharus]KEY91466.1 UDP-N-acetylgalactosaminyltransferase [Candidatus Photodesmus blepharus]